MARLLMAARAARTVARERGIATAVSVLGRAIEFATEGGKAA